MTSFHFSPRPNRAAEVRWREWSPEAFREAKEADKPILLGISAVWCHWCHVMDETSYSDPDVIRLVNERFVAIRVDNDRRPDVNRRYNMGGWPTTAFLTPDGEILHGGTYIPPDQMRHYLAEVADLWRDRRDELVARIAEARAKQAAAPAPGALSWEIVDQVASLIRGQYDPQYGGFGSEPKFPQPPLLRFLIDEYERDPSSDAAAMLHKTLGAMAGGGMYDHVAGGFFRYSTTRQWQVPHYEKMLEDNAELLRIYADAHRLFPSAGYDRVARDVMRWMDATLWMPDADAFAGSQDADEHYYSLDSQARARHGTPYVDRTIYTSWNALAASAYVAASRALDDPAVEIRAHAVVHALAGRMWRRQAPRLFHYDAGAGPQLPDLLADLAAYLTAVLDTYETGLHPVSLGFAVDIAAHLRRTLEDDAQGGYWDAPQRDELGRVTKREKPIEDGAVAADALLRLAALTDDGSWRRSALRALEALVPEYRGWGQFAAGYARSVARALTDPLIVSVVGADAEADALWHVARRHVDPALSRRRLDDVRDADRLRELGYPPDRSAAYVCVGTACSAPISDPLELERELERTKGRLHRE